MNSELNLDSVVRVVDVLRYLETDCYMDSSRSANYMGTSLRTFDEWKAKIVRYKPGGKTLFKRSDLDAFMARHRIEPGSEPNLTSLADEVIASVTGGSR